MGKKSRTKSAAESNSATAPGEVGPRQPCPCGSGKRYKACHGKAGGAAPTFVKRPFAGLPNEVDLIAVREFVPAATAEVTIDGIDQPVLLCSLLPNAVPAMVRPTGQIRVGLQVQHGYGDPSRDLAAVIQRARGEEPGSVVGLPQDPGMGDRLQDLLGSQEINFTVHENFDFWLDDVDQDESTKKEALSEANASASPTARVGEGAYWTRMGDREYLRLVLPHQEDPLLDAMARIQVSGKATLIDGDRLIGTFRAHGILAPVWEFPLGTGPDSLPERVAAVHTALAHALEVSTALTPEERSARSGLSSRQVTIR